MSQIVPKKDHVEKAQKIQHEFLFTTKSFLVMSSKEMYY